MVTPFCPCSSLPLSRLACGAIQVTLFYVLPGGASAQETSETKYRCVCAQSLGRVQFFATPMDCSPPGSSAHGIVQAKILEQLLFPSPEDLPEKRLNLGLLHLLYWQMDSLPLSQPPGKPGQDTTLSPVFIRPCPRKRVARNLH